MANALMSEPDSIFVRIEWHRALWDLFCEIVKEETRLSELIPEHRRRQNNVAVRYKPFKHDDPRWTNLQGRYWTVIEAVDQVAFSFIERPPKLPAEAAVLLAYIREFEAAGCEWPDLRQ
jgi:hypothetical protein